MDWEIDAELVGKLAAMCAAENGRQKKWIYKFSFYIKWVHISRRPWAGADVGYRDIDYFIARFVELKGCTPTRFRKSSRKKA